MPDKRALTAPINGRKGGAPRRPHAATRLRAAIAQKHAELTAEAVVEQIARGALFDPRDFFDAQGNYKPIHDLTEAQRQCIASVEVILKNAAAGESVADRVLRYKFVDRFKYVEMAAKLHGLLVSRIDATVNVEAIGARLDEARQRAAKAGVALRV